MPHWAYCCACPRDYHVKVFENNSGTLELARRSFAAGSAVVASGLRWNGTSLVVQLFPTSSAEPLDRAKILNVTLADVQTITHDYKYSAVSNQTTVLRALNTAGTGDVVMQSRRITSTDRGAVVSKSSSDALNWETCFDAGSPTPGAVAGDSSGNVYAVANDIIDIHLYLFNSSGVKQWKTTIASGPLIYPILVVVDSGDNCWVSYGGESGPTSVTLKRVNTSGTVIQTISISDRQTTDTYSSMCSDGSTGIWIYVKSGSTREIRRYDSAGALITTISESTLLRQFAIDSSNNVYALCSSGAAVVIKKYDVTGSLQWTSAAIGWSTAGVDATDLAVDGSYIFVCGIYHAS